MFSVAAGAGEETEEKLKTVVARERDVFEKHV